jgi:hypothetical protein
MDVPRHSLLLSILGLGLLALVWHIYSGWGLVTINVEEERVDRVLASISRQGGIEIISNLPADTRVSLHVRRVPAVEALDIVAVRTDASWQLAYLGAPDQRTIDIALATFRAGTNPDKWTSFSAGRMGGGGLSPSGKALDLRQVEWTPDGEANLQILLQEAAEKTGGYLAAPSDWSPQVSSPGSGTVAETIPRIFQNAGGTSREVFLVRADESRSGAPAEDDDRGGWGQGGGWIGRPASPSTQTSGRGPANIPTERLAQRAEAQIALLPPDEQPQAREDLETMRKFWDEVRNLPEEQRRERARDFFTSPAMQERMEERRAARENKMTPKQIIQRSQRYWDRKAAAKYGSDS